MTTNDSKLLEKVLSKHGLNIEEVMSSEGIRNGLILDMMYEMEAEARSDTTSKHIGAIWNWWATKPQKSKNDATTRIITRADIEELVRMME